MKLTRNDIAAICAEGWADIDTALARAEALGLLPEVDRKAYYKAELRRAFKRIKDPNGLPVVWNLTEVDAEGNERHIYKTREMFPLEDYQRAVNSEVREANLHIRLATGLCDEAYARYHVQIHLPL